MGKTGTQGSYAVSNDNDTECTKSDAGHIVGGAETTFVNVLTISQSMPIHGTANVVMTLDITQLSGSLENAIAALGAMRGVENAMLVSIE